MHISSKIVIASLATIIVAHPGEHHTQNEVHELSKREYRTATRRGLAACADKLEARGGLVEQAASRRADLVARHRKARGLEVRDTDTILNTSHLSTQGYTVNTPEDVIFASNKTCILNPQGEVGPFWVKGEFIRTNLRDGQPGIPIIIEGQFLDVETCEPITDVHWDFCKSLMPSLCTRTNIWSREL